MSLSDPIADMLTRIRNASAARKPDVQMPFSGIKKAVADILRREGFVSGVSVEGEGVKRVLSIRLKFTPDETPVIQGLRRVSRPGRRDYCGSDQVPRVLNGIGVAILTTSSGLMTDQEARRAGVGGEVLCHVW